MLILQCHLLNYDEIPLKLDKLSGFVIIPHRGIGLKQAHLDLKMFLDQIEYMKYTVPSAYIQEKLNNTIEMIETAYTRTSIFLFSEYDSKQV